MWGWNVCLSSHCSPCKAPSSQSVSLAFWHIRLVTRLARCWQVEGGQVEDGHVGVLSSLTCNSYKLPGKLSSSFLFPQGGFVAECVYVCMTCVLSASIGGCVVLLILQQ